jgi:hypothetical protein
MVHPSRFERETSAFGGQRSIQLSYGCLPNLIKYLLLLLRIESHGTRCLSTHDLCAIYGQMYTKRCQR